MKDDEAAGLCEQLRQLIKSGPGISAPAQHQVDRILSYIAHEFGRGSYVYEKLLDVREGFAVWFDPRKLIAPEADAIQAMHLIYADIAKLERALGTHLLPEDLGRTTERAEGTS